MPGPITTQNSFSLVSRAVEGDLAEALHREGMSLLAYSPLAGGILSGKYRGGAQPPNARFTLFDSFGARFRKPMVREAVNAYAGIAERHGLTMVQLALWFVASQIIGATTLAQLEEDVAAAQVELDAATLADIADVHLRYPNPAGY